MPEGLRRRERFNLSGAAFHGGVVSDYVKLHTAVLHNRKIQTLPPSLILPWVNFLLLSRLHGGILPDIREISFQLHVDQATALAWVMALRKLRLIDQDGERGDFVMHDWEEWNPPSPKDPTAAARQAKRRAKIKELNSMEGNIRVTERDAVTVTARDIVTKRADIPTATATAIRRFFPTTDDAMVLHIWEEAVKTHLEVAGPDAPPIDDSWVAEAIVKARFAKQYNAFPFVKNIAQMVRNKFTPQPTVASSREWTEA